ncbi:hypothetical protein WJX72_006093 [[Myrmecia] bisecta]|uniref:PX domain-containing protein n=1 Tax=[Myrmecia] bisecta TaxID=41462 RepID=A0AAW1PEG8_9CHLO
MAFPSSGFSDPFSEAPPPPPYESVVIGGSNTGVVPSVGSPPHEVPLATKAEFDIQVTDPVKHGDGVSAYVSYKVITRTNLEQYKNRQPEVIRRFRDFAWLAARLQEQNRGIIVPPIPEKNVVQKYQMTTEFIEGRRRALTSFISRVAAHPVLQTSRDLQNFLEASEDEWATEVSRAQYESSGAKKRFSNTLQMFKDLGHSTAALVTGKSADEEEEPDYLQVREYVFQLETQLAEAQRQAARLIKRQAELGLAMAEFGTSMVSLGKFEKGPLADSFMRLGEKAEALSHAGQEQANQLTTSFEAPLRESVRMVKSAKAVMADRSNALAALQQARADVDSKRTKLAKLRGTPGIKEEKVGEAERELNEASHKVEAAKEGYALIVRRMSEELARFQRERAQDMAALLRDFVLAQAQLATDTAKLWRQEGAPAANGVH